MEHEEGYENIFVKPILEKRKTHDFKAWLKLRKAIKFLDTSAPTFEVLMMIWELVYCTYYSYMNSYVSDSPLHLFLGTNENSAKVSIFAMIYKEDNFSIKFILEPKTNVINIEIDRNTSTMSSSKNRKEQISFVSGSLTSEDMNEYDEAKFGFINSCIMNGAKELMMHFYKNKKF